MIKIIIIVTIVTAIPTTSQSNAANKTGMDMIIIIN